MLSTKKLSMKYFKIIEHISTERTSRNDLDCFNLHLINDPVLRNDYEAYNDSLQFLSEQGDILKETIHNTQDFRFSIDAAFESLKTTSGTSDELTKELSGQIRATIIAGRNNGLRSYNGWLKAAAIFIFILLASFPASEPLASYPFVVSLSKFEPLQYYPSVTRGIDKHRSSMSYAWKFYSNQKVDSAIIVLNRLGYLPEQEAEWVIFKSICLIEKNDFEEALQVLDKLPDDCLFRINSLWYKAICYANLNNREEAIRLLDEIARIDRIYKKSARKLKHYLITYPLLEVNFSPSECIKDGIYR